MSKIELLSGTPLDAEMHSVLTEPALAFGYNVRNLQTLVMLERLTQLLSLR